MTDKIAQHHAAAQTLYGTAHAGGGSLDLSLGNYYKRHEAALLDDPERLAQSRTEQAQLATLARSRNISPEALHTGLSALREHEHSHSRRTLSGDAPPAQDALVKQTFETLRLEEGSEANARALWERAQRGATVVEKAVPTLAKRASEAGALVDPTILRFLASVADEPTQERK